MAARVVRLGLAPHILHVTLFSGNQEVSGGHFLFYFVCSLIFGIIRL
jgi:hypothetical protein